MKKIFLFNSKTEGVKGNFYTRLEANCKSIEIVENCELTNDFKQNVCLPYFKDAYKVLPTLI